MYLKILSTPGADYEYYNLIVPKQIIRIRYKTKFTICMFKS